MAARVGGPVDKGVHNKKSETARVQPTPPKPVALHTRKNLSFKARVGGTFATGAAQWPFQARGRTDLGFRNNLVWNGSPTSQVISPWAVSPVQTPNPFGRVSFGGGY